MRDNNNRLSVRRNTTLANANTTVSRDSITRALLGIFPTFGGFFIDTIANQTQDSDGRVRNIIFGSRGNDKWMYLTTCAANLTYVDALVNCQSPGSAQVHCAVDKIRKTPSPPSPASLTAFNSTVVGGNL